MPEQGSWRPTDKPQEGSWSPQPSGVHQICYLLAEVQKPGSDQGQVRGNFGSRKAKATHLGLIFCESAAWLHSNEGIVFRRYGTSPGVCRRVTWCSPNVVG